MDCITSERHIAQDRLLHEGELLISNNVYCSIHYRTLFSSRWESGEITTLCPGSSKPIHVFCANPLDLIKRLMVPGSTPVVLAIEAFETPNANNLLISSVCPSSFDLPKLPFGLPSFLPLPLAAARPSLVCMETNSRSASASKPNILTIA